VVRSDRSEARYSAVVNRVRSYLSLAGGAVLVAGDVAEAVEVHCVEVAPAVTARTRWTVSTIRVRALCSVSTTHRRVAILVGRCAIGARPTRATGLRWAVAVRHKRSVSRRASTVPSGQGTWRVSTT
jgi:hypothetical protein